MRRGIISGMDTIFIHDLRVETRIGVYDWERELPQTVRLDVELGLPSDKVFRSGEFADALDYAAVVKRLQAFAADHPHQLLERFAAGDRRCRAWRIRCALGQGPRSEAGAGEGRQGDRRRHRAQQEIAQTGRSAGAHITKSNKVGAQRNAPSENIRRVFTRADGAARAALSGVRARRACRSSSS